MQINKFSKDLINDLIRSRRSVFPTFYSGEIITDEIIQQLLENANWAPTHRFTEPWRFKVFTNEGIKKLAEYQSNLYKDKTPDQEFQESKFKNLLEKPLKCSHIISIGMQRDPEKSIPEIEEIAAVAMAVQNMYLTATAYGIGCYWGTGGITYMDEAKSFFDLGPEDKLMGFLYLGIPGRDIPDGKRRSLLEKISWVRN